MPTTSTPPALNAASVSTRPYQPQPMRPRRTLSFVSSAALLRPRAAAPAASVPRNTRRCMRSSRWGPIIVRSSLVLAFGALRALGPPPPWRPSMKKVVLFSLAVLLAAANVPAPPAAADEGPSVPTLAIGASAPDFDLPGVDGKRYTLASFAKAKVLVIVFTANHCPTAQAYEGRIEKLHADFKDRGVQVVLVSPNDPKALPLDEQGWSDLGDSFADMKIRAKDRAWTFP